MGENTRKKKKINWFMVMLLVPALAMLTVTIIILLSLQSAGYGQY